ncbi:trypsin-like peptidase domain-containing protein [Natrialba sp. PRR66]|uniref:S1C family serine protease n=1 Tax=Natrialba sp. PRR66 TaxID=3098146 RepID=UPI002B1D863C|nr:trypsin-like peptidase domain-containing protein [Natrialba sp. PRR66]
MSTPTTFEQLYRETIPSVVSVYVDPERRRPGGTGSGFVYDADHVITNRHVVGDVDAVDLRFSDASWETGRVIGTDAHTDLAVIRTDALPSDADPLPIADRPPTPGEPVAALGNPMGLDGTITTGIVSGVNRSSPTGSGFTIPDTVQTDAPINPGNSGGPLVTLDGTVVGVNRAKTGENIGFAISAAVVSRVVPDLVERGRFRHPYLRVQTVDVSPTVAEANDLATPEGVLVVDAPLGPASAALHGCRSVRRVRGRDVPVGGDVIVGIDGHEIDSHEELQRYLLTETRPGQPIEIAVRRQGRRTTEEVVLAERPGRATDPAETRAHVPIE